MAVAHIFGACFATRRLHTNNFTTYLSALDNFEVGFC